MYGGMMTAMKGAKWLFRTHAVNVTAKAETANHASQAGARPHAKPRTDTKAPASTLSPAPMLAWPPAAAGAVVANAFEMPTTGAGGEVVYTGRATLWPIMLAGRGADTALLSVGCLPTGTGAADFEASFARTRRRVALLDWSA